MNYHSHHVAMGTFLFLTLGVQLCVHTFNTANNQRLEVNWTDHEIMRARLLLAKTSVHPNIARVVAFLYPSLLMLLIGASVSEPHTSLFNFDFS